MTDAASATVRAHDPDAAYVTRGPGLPESVRAGVRVLVDVLGPGLDPLTDDLASADGSYDAVWAHANAPLLHVARPESLGPGRRGEQWLEVTAVRG